MISFLFIFAHSLLDFNELNLDFSFSGVHQKDNYFSSKEVIGFHSCGKTKLNITSSFRERYVHLSFSKLNSSHYINRHCQQLIIDPFELKHLSKTVTNGYFTFFLNGISSNQTVDCGGYIADLNMMYVYTDFLISVKGGQFEVKPLTYQKLNFSVPVTVMSVTFYLIIEPGFSNQPNRILPVYNFFPISYSILSLSSFVPSIIAVIFWSRKSKTSHIPLISNFYKVSIFISNTLLFSSSGLIIIIQSVFYLAFNHSRPFRFQFFNNLAFPSLIVPIILRIFYGRILNLYTTEADFMSASLGTVFFIHASVVVLNGFNLVFFHSFRFMPPIFFCVSFVSYLAVLFIVTRGVGYFALATIPDARRLPFENQLELTRGEISQNQIKMPSVASLIAYAMISAVWLAKMSHHLVLVSMDLAVFDINFVFAFMSVFLAASALFSCVRTRYRINTSKDRGSWMEDHLLYNICAGFLVCIVMIVDTLFVTGVKSFEMLLHSLAISYSTFGILFETGAAISFLFAFIQVYFSVLRHQMK